ncbi:uncharacterized protein TRIADDRAFT_23227, partial [Trichoplax adhaerens]
WLNKLFQISAKRRLELEDLYQLSDADKSDALLKKFDREWDKELKVRDNGGRPSLTRALFRIFGFSYLLIGIPCLIGLCSRTVYPIFIGLLVGCFSPQSTADKTQGYLYALGLSLSMFIIVFCEQPAYFSAYRVGSQLRTVLSAAVYRKTLNLSSGAVSQITIGRIVNILANDMLKFNDVTKYLHYLWIGTLVGIAMIVVLWLQVGFAALGVIIALIFILALKTYIASLLAKERLRYLRYADERIKIMNEIITGMRVIKMYAWEKPFSKIVTHVRGKEIKHALRIAYMRAFHAAMQFISLRLMLFCSVVIYGLFGNPLDLARIFTVFTLLLGIRLIFMFCIPEAIQNISETSVSLKRIQDYLLAEELPNISLVQLDKNYDMNNKEPVEVNNLSIWWSDENRPVLKDISFMVKENELCAVVGPVGSGKSTLLVTLLNDVTTFSGHYRVRGKIAYASQQAWIVSDTLRNNILFGLEYDDAKYNEVIDACALRKDLDLLPNGDMTFVGERGVQLSGGQRMRVNLARAVYYNADIYLLDDPLSAVDADVGKHIYQRCICGYLSNKTRVLVTHQLHHLRSADKIVVLKDGRIDKIDTFQNLQINSDVFSMTTQQQSLKTFNNELAESTITQNKIENNNGGVIEEENRNRGSIPWRVYIKYFTSAFGPTRSVFACILFVASQASFNVADWWFSQWSYAYQNISLSRNSSVELNTVIMYDLSNADVIAIYAGQLGICFLLVMICSWVLGAMAVRASKRLESKLFHSLLETIIYIFDTYPSGRILNRFSKDCAQMDDNIGYNLVFTVQCILVCIGQVLTIAIVNPWMLIPITIISVLLIFLRKYYLNLSRDVKRLEAAGSSPLYSHMSTTLQGLTTVRAYGASSRFLETFKEYLDMHTQSWIVFIASIRWNAFHIDFLCSFLVAGLSFSLVLLPEGYINPGLSALLLSYAVDMLGLLDWVVRLSSELENQMTSVERVDEYTKLQKENKFYKEIDPPTKWPQLGTIKFNNVCFTHYKTLPYVLQSITCEIKKFEKIGIVGRTGAGKSSFLASMFRLAEPTGQISIDDVVINNIGLHCLRSSLSVIPQDPVLFIGTIRKNLDPFNCYNDEELWKALKEVEMENYVIQLPDKLDSEVSEFGTNFSVGQRQLLCLARALLKKNRILCIDEATANVDLKTDAIIQRTIRKQFIECTVLVIAHRISTIIDCDRVMVLDAGKLVEFDSPHKLLELDSYFSKLVAETGIEESKNLRVQAEYHYNHPEVFARSDKADIAEINLETDISFKGDRRQVKLLEIGIYFENIYYFYVS